MSLNSGTPLIGRITDAESSDMGQFPFMAYIRLVFLSKFCGGSIISNSFILSAAHCFDK